MKNKLILIYDYDGTLAPGSIQEPMLIPLLMPEFKDDPKQFWRLPNERARSGGLDGNLMYMNVLIEKAQERGIDLTRDFLKKCGSFSRHFPGVLEWFERINHYGEEKGVPVEHYIISAGNEELLIGTKIARYFKAIHACRFYFNERGIATEAGSTLNDHTKLKFIEETRLAEPGSEDDDGLKTPYMNMIYIGDGMTDIPAMKLISRNGGLAFAVYSDEEGRMRMAGQMERNAVSALYPTRKCYTRGSVMEKRIFKEIDRIGRANHDSYQQMTIFDFLS